MLTKLGQKAVAQLMIKQRLQTQRVLGGSPLVLVPQTRAATAGKGPSDVLDACATVTCVPR